MAATGERLGLRVVGVAALHALGGEVRSLLGAACRGDDAFRGHAAVEQRGDGDRAYEATRTAILPCVWPAPSLPSASWACARS